MPAVIVIIIIIRYKWMESTDFWFSSDIKQAVIPTF